ncbi:MULTISPECIES: carbohydrate porin [unclassified Burkholderia]|uniref:carbohydrate porin n=1 Tax=unclassified Burkholderia TaxID=2613784 RepID=UPI001FC88410|nr:MULTISPECIES: carbohydrate porin [unclassified Burkholderia]
MKHQSNRDQTRLYAGMHGAVTAFGRLVSRQTQSKLAVALMLAGSASFARADDASATTVAYALDSATVALDSTGNSRSSSETPPLIGTVRDQASDRDAAHPIFWKAGQALQNVGITPSLSLTQFYLDNPSAGQQTGNHEALTVIAVGADVNLQKMLGVPGAIIHFQQLFAPSVVNTLYGGQVGDSIVGQPSPYVPRKAYLTLFTWEQKFLEGRGTVEFGKSNAGNYFAVPVCEIPLGCFSPILQDAGQINPIVSANWGVRAAYKFTNEITAQVGFWKSDANYPFNNGWTWSAKGPQSNTYLTNVTYRTNPQQDRYAKNYELLFFYNSASHNAFKSPGPIMPGPYKGSSGVYFGAKQVVWHPDGNIAGTPGAFSLSVFGNFTSSFDQHNASGLESTGTLGLTAKGLLKSRPYDTVSARVIYTRNTASEQSFIERTNLAFGGTGYNVGRNEYAVRVDANIIVTPTVIVSPYIVRTFNTNSEFTPFTTAKPNNGIAYGIIATFLFDKMLGLSGS